MIEFYSQVKSVSQLLEMKNELNYDLAVQRAEDLWSNEAKSLLIHSILYGYPVPAVWTVEKDGLTWNFVDGKQRVKSGILDFAEGKYELNQETPDIEEEKIAGLKFDQLSEKLQKRLLNSSVTVNLLRNVTDEEIEEFFRRINNGLSLSQIQITRVLAGSKIMNYIKEIANTHFFREVVPIPEKSRRKNNTDEELIMQIIALVVNKEPVGLSGKELHNLAKRLRVEGLSEEYQKLIRETTDYLDNAIPDLMKNLRKLHVPMVFLMAIQAQEKRIPAKQFGGWVQQFFIPKKFKVSLYKTEYSKDKTANISNVQGRLAEMQRNFDDNIENAPDYRKPEPGQRGRKPRANTAENQDVA